MSTPLFFRKQDVENKPVIDSSGKSIGTGLDIAFSLDGRLGLVVKTPKGSEIEIPMNRVIGVTDYIVLSPEGPSSSQVVQVQHTEPLTPTQPLVSSNTQQQTCSSCGMSLKPGAKFCTSCGFRTSSDSTSSSPFSKLRRKT